METTPLTQQLLKQFMTKAYENAKAKGFYKPDLDINQALMLIITEMGETFKPAVTTATEALKATTRI